MVMMMVRNMYQNLSITYLQHFLQEVPIWKERLWRLDLQSRQTWWREFTGSFFWKEN